MFGPWGKTFARAPKVAAVLTAVMFSFSACSSGDSVGGESLPDYDPTPQQLNSAAPEADIEQLRIPLQLKDLPTVDPQWATKPKCSNDIFLAADDADGVLTYRAVDSTGTVLWEAERPQSCTGFALTSVGEDAIAVLSDLEPTGEGFGKTTVSGYELSTGDRMWGPVEVAGQHVGPGAVFASSPASQIGEIGPKVVLDPATGEVLVDEREHEQVRVVGEYHGTIVMLQDGQLQAYAAATLAQSGDTPKPQWAIDADEHGWSPDQVHSADAGDTAPLNAALVGNTGGELSLVDLETGEIIASGITDAVQDPSSQTWVTLGDELVGHAPAGAEYFREPVDGMEFQGIGSAMVYLLNSEGGLEARNVITGDVGRAYDPNESGTPAVPTYISPSGTGVLRADEGYLLAPAD